MVGRKLGVDVLATVETRKGKAPFARQLVMYVAHCNLGYDVVEAGDIFDFNHSTVSHAKKVIDGFRDVDKGFETRFGDILNYYAPVPGTPKGWIRYPKGEIVICAYCKGVGSKNDQDPFTSEVHPVTCPSCGGCGRLEEVRWLRRLELLM